MCWRTLGNSLRWCLTPKLIIKNLTPNVTTRRCPILKLTLRLSLNFQEKKTLLFLLVTDLGTHCNDNGLLKQETREEKDVLEELIPVCVERLGDSFSSHALSPRLSRANNLE